MQSSTGKSNKTPNASPLCHYCCSETSSICAERGRHSFHRRGWSKRRISLHVHNSNASWSQSSPPDFTVLPQSVASSFTNTSSISSLCECEHDWRSSWTYPCINYCYLLVFKNVWLQARVRKGGYIKRPVKLTIILPRGAALCGSNDHFMSPVVDDIPYLQCCLPFRAWISF